MQSTQATTTFQFYSKWTSKGFFWICTYVKSRGQLLGSHKNVFSFELAVHVVYA